MENILETQILEFFLSVLKEGEDHVHVLYCPILILLKKIYLANFSKSIHLKTFLFYSIGILILLADFICADLQSTGVRFRKQ